MFNPPNIRIFNGINYFCEICGRDFKLYTACIATGLIVALFFSVKAFTLGPGGVHSVELTYIKYTPYLILLILITILQLLAVFTFNARVFQMRTAVLSAILMIALQAWIGVWIISQLTRSGYSSSPRCPRSWRPS